jgi:hypothetical protein
LGEELGFEGAERLFASLSVDGAVMGTSTGRFDEDVGVNPRQLVPLCELLPKVALSAPLESNEDE